MLTAASSSTPNNEYLHWDKLLRKNPPTGLTHMEWWWGIKLHRRTGSKSIPLHSTSNKNFWFGLPDPIPAILHEIDLRAGGTIQVPRQITNPDMKDRYYVGSLIEEAITSSQIEGAVTTRQVAKDMIRSGRKPSDRSERMILNNFITMRRIGELKDRPLTGDLVFEIHRLITEDTLENPIAAGRMRLNDESEKVVVDDMYGEVYHTPPSAAELPARLKAMCDFANGKTPAVFVHPVLRSIILHFWLAYDHPFLDGNGRTARALFYWSMLRHNYWLFEFISISPIILKAPSRYQLAFLHTETDDCDLTYFILYHLDVIQKAIRHLHAYIKRKTEQVQQLEASLRGAAALNHRQRALISHALRHPRQTYTIESHRLSHNIVYETARKDLHELAERNLLNAVKVGKEWHFTPTDNLEGRLSQLS
ncbi:MAG: Fic family protein [Pirellulaceae bacterium]|nr:Fic family protein [Pirellulaceae bacterium]